jgi:hypothetical protein
VAIAHQAEGDGSCEEHTRGVAGRRRGMEKEKKRKTLMKGGRSKEKGDRMRRYTRRLREENMWRGRKQRKEC